MTKNRSFGVGILIFLSFVVFYTLNSTFLAVIMEKYRIIVLKRGTGREETKFRKKIDKYVKIVRNKCGGLSDRLFKKCKKNKDD